MPKRDAILERLAAFALEKRREAATLRAMTSAAGQSDRMLLYYFKDKDEIISEVLGLLAAQLTDQLEAHTSPAKLRKEALHAVLDGVVLADEIWPYLRLRLDLAARAARHDPIYAPVARSIGEGFHQWIDAQLLSAAPNLRRTQATESMIGLEGVIVLNSVGMQALVHELIWARALWLSIMNARKMPMPTCHRIFAPALA